MSALIFSFTPKVGAKPIPAWHQPSADYGLANSSLIAGNAVWKYLDDSSDQGTNWHETAFADGSWKSGLAELGYGDNDEATTVSYGLDEDNKHITTYFRHAFTVTSPSLFSGLLRLRLLRDDGAVVYLNGIEVFRDNMPVGVITSTTPAFVAVGGSSESTFYDAMIEATHLVTGTNVVAVEIHQANPASSDISFNLELIATLTTGPCLMPTTRFAVIGDYGLASQPEADVAALVRSLNPDFIITLGDNNYNLGEASTIDQNIGQYYHDYIGNYTGSYGSGATSNAFFPALGNHDWETNSGVPPLPQPYLDYFTLPGNERYYTVTHNAVTLFALDSDSREPDGISSGSVQASWLQTQLAMSNTPWKVVYLHHAPYSSAASHGSQPILQWPYRAWGADAVLAGHDHTYERLVVDGLPYFVNGVGGRNIRAFGTPIPGSLFRYNGDFGAMLIEANATCLTFSFISRLGQVVDSYSIENTEYLSAIFLPVLIKE